MEKLLIIGGAGFIGTNASYFFSKKKYKIMVIDKLTYAADIDNLKPLIRNKKILFKKIDICNFNSLKLLLNSFKPNIIINFAAESHVDNSINNPNNFYKSNVLGVYNILYAIKILQENKHRCYFFQVSTDEVYGSLKKGYAKESSNINPSSPYSASKAAGDALVLGMCKTFNIKFNISRCTNNFGPFQYPEKLIPLSLKKTLKQNKIQIYGNGKNKRDWIYVDDHINAIYQIIKKGKKNNIYNIGANNIYTNNNLIKILFKILNNLKSKSVIKNFQSKIDYIKDRPAHDLRYAVNVNKIFKDTKWKVKTNFEKSLEQTVLWYLNKFDWHKNDK